MESVLTPIAEQVARKRYYKKDDQGNPIENWEDLSRRVVNHVCSNENQDFKDQAFDLIYQTKFLPNSPCLVNAGRNGKSRGLLACFVSKSPEDSWPGMVENIANFGHIARQGGGCGVSFSKIRPEGDPVFGSTHAKACGPIEHMRMVSEVMSAITQSGFRGMAMMGTLDVSHPDVMKFIVCKQRERALKTLLKEDIFNHYDQFKKNISDQLAVVLDKFIYNFNISVVVNNAFMKAIEEDRNWDLYFNGKIYETMKARDIFQSIVRNAWQNGDPGLLFWDAMNSGPYRYSQQWLNATNPCVTGDSLVATEYGWRKAEDVAVGDMVFSRGKLYPVHSIEINKNHAVYRVEFSDGDYIDVTPSHRFKCVVGKQYQYIRTDELGIGAKVLVEPIEIDLMKQNPINVDTEDVLVKHLIEHPRDLGLLIGTVLGDGCFTERTTNRNMVYIAFGKTENKWRQSFTDLLDKYKIKYYLEEDSSTFRVRSTQLGHILDILSVDRNVAKNKKVPKNLLETNNKELIIGIIDGLFSTDGSMYLKKDNPLLRFSNSSEELCRQLRRMLLSIGVHAKIYRTERKEHTYIDPRYGPRKISTANDKFDLVIMNVGIKKFSDVILLSNPYKNDRIVECVERYHYVGDWRTSSVKSITALDGLHTVYDLYVKETDEWNVNGYVQQGCGEQVLPEYGSCNLGSIDVSKFYNEEANDIDWGTLRSAVCNSIQFLDDVIDANVFPTPDFAEWAKDNRPVGLGIMGFADLLLKLKIAYGSKESLTLADKLGSFFATEAHNKSVELGKQRGTPKCCQFDELEHRRNVTTISIAPTGTIAQLAGCSHAIEPLYAETVFRYDNTGSKEFGTHVDADKPYFRCALSQTPEKQVTWQQHVDMQAAFQKNCDSAISKTINMPGSATMEDIASAYIRAWKAGCKGITIYRDGSKTTQVLTTDSKDNDRRPKSVPCQIFKTTAEGFDWHVIIGLVNNRPYELFAVNGRVDLPKEGTVIKRKRRHYSLLDLDGNTLIDNLSEEEDHIHPKVSLETRRFSLELRNGIDPAEIVEQIDKSHETIASFSKAASRVLKKSGLVRTQERCEEVCPECAKQGEFVNLVHEAGCKSCPKCQHALCG